MANKDSGVSLTPEQYQEIYECRNGKGKSCIETRNIPESKKNCALGHIIGGLSTEELLGAIKTPQEKEPEKNIPQEIYNKRLEFVESIKKEYGYDLPFQKLDLPFEKLESGKKGYKGTRVKIDKESKYAHQNDREGIITEEDGSSRLPFHVRFDDGYENSYGSSDLVRIKEKSETEAKDVEKKNETIVSDIAKQTDEDFFAKSAEVIFDALSKDQEFKNKMFPNEKFNKGDKIVMNKLANDEYGYTQEGSTGEILNKAGKEFNVRFDHITGGDYSGSDPTREVGPKYMINTTKKSDKKVTLSDVSKKLQDIVKGLQEKKESRGRGDESASKKSLTTKLLLQENFLLPGDKEGNYVLNYREMVKFVAPDLYAAYGNKELYSQEDMCAPPSECHPNVLKFELSHGCNYNRCTYCDLYKNVKYCPRTFAQFKEHVDKVMEAVGSYKNKIERLFIGGGNALAVDDKTLLDSLNYVNNKLHPRKISMYARTQDINRKGAEGIEKLTDAGLTNLYRGAETGSDEILKYIKKGTTLDDMLKASKNLAKTDINLSVTLMPGIGGKRFDEENIKGTVKFLNATDTKYITFMAISPSANSEYDNIMKDELMAGTNRPLSNVEVVKQIKEILKGLEPKGQKIGMYGPEIHEVDYNPFYFKITFDRDGKEEAINLCDEYLKTHVI
ncbi:MAG: radical SAM protein [candidate division SR1 bacterium]|nr:radical SAM protein [candidate division SR1 bacterium]